MLKKKRKTLKYRLDDLELETNVLRDAYISARR